MYPREAIDFERLPRATQARIRERVGGFSGREGRGDESLARNTASCCAAEVPSLVSTKPSPARRSE